MTSRNHVLIAPPNTMPRIDHVWVYLSRDVNGNEGLCATVDLVRGALMPLIAADEERLKQLTPIAETLAAESGMTITLAKFTRRSDIREIRGKSS